MIRVVVRTVLAGLGGPRYIICLSVMAAVLTYWLLTAAGWVPDYDDLADASGMHPMVMLGLAYVAIYLAVSAYWTHRALTVDDGGLAPGVREAYRTTDRGGLIVMNVLMLAGIAAAAVWVHDHYRHADNRYAVLFVLFVAAVPLTLDLWPWSVPRRVVVRQRVVQPGDPDIITDGSQVDNGESVYDIAVRLARGRRNPDDLADYLSAYNELRLLPEQYQDIHASLPPGFVIEIPPGI